MGIPGYFGYVVGRYPGIVVDSGILGATIVAEHDGVNGADCLYLDYNNLVHNCARHATLGKQFPRQDAMFQAVFEHVADYTRRIATLVAPSKLLYLAVDGVPPFAKIVQQRKRRFMAVAEAKFKGGPTGQWHSSYVTPGTRFMAQLSTSLKKLRTDLQKALGIEVVLSSWDEKGEGEHKIFADLRKRDPGMNVVVYGMDADMLMLGLLHETQKVVVMRQHHEAPMDAPRMEHFQFVVVDHLRGALSRELRRPPDEAALDYICLCVLVGNDFLPPLCFLGVDAIPMLLRTFAGLHERLVTREAGSDGCFVRFSVLRSLMAHLARQEDKLMIAADAKYWRAKPPPPYAGVAPKDHAWMFLPLLRKFADKVRPREPGWRLRYARALLGGTSHVARAVNSYLEGVEWVMRYYLSHAAPNLAWSYQFPYSPPATNLHARLVEHPGLRAGWEVHNRLPFEVTPELQLLAVLPPTQHAMVPRKLQRIMSDVSLGAAHMYPTTFEMHTYLKNRVYECSPAIPPLDIRLLADAVSRVSVSQT
jgi:5'-3' exonuclease